LTDTVIEDNCHKNVWYTVPKID